MHINEAIAWIIGERAEYFKIRRDIEIKVTSVYHDYLHDANHALRALVWLDRHMGDFIVYLEPEFKVILVDVDGDFSLLSQHDTAGMAICRAVIETAKIDYPDLLDYSAIDCGEDDLKNK
jgi:hypothetical protein